MLSFEHFTGLDVAMHDLSGHLRAYINTKRINHMNPFCRLMKVPPYASICNNFEVDQLRPLLHKHRHGLVKRCHAGLVEWTYPLFLEDNLHAVLFAGQAITKDSLHLTLKDRQSSSAINLWPKSYPKPKPVSQEHSDLYLEALRQVGQRLQNWLGEYFDNERWKDEQPGTASLEQHRRQLIVRFLEVNHHHDIRLKDLAEHLHLSPSRLAHLVKAYCGLSFSPLLNSIRLKHATRLLEETSHSILDIGQRCGYQDTSAFHKNFKKVYGLTPLAYRKGQQSHMIVT